jgi:hypothetical protein
MISFVTLGTITLDLLNIVRSSNISRSELISPRQIEMWIHQYRAILIKQELDKGKMPNPDYIQELPALELELVDRSKGADLETGNFLLRTKLALPKTIDLNFKSGFMYVGTIDDREIQFVPESRARWQHYKKYTGRDSVAFLKGGHIYLIYPQPIEFISVRGVFEVPTEVGNFTNAHADFTYANWTTPYPISEHMIPVLKSMILQKELGIMVQSMSDTSNDAINTQGPNTEPQQ